MYFINFRYGVFTLTILTYYKTRKTGTLNNRTQNTCGTAKHPRTVTEQWINSGTLRNTNGTPTQRNTSRKSGTTEPYKTNNICSDFKQNLNLTLIHLTLSTQGLRFVYTKLKSFLTNKYHQIKQANNKFESPLQHLASNIKEFK